VHAHVRQLAAVDVNDQRLDFHLLRLDVELVDASRASPFSVFGWRERFLLSISSLARFAELFGRRTLKHAANGHF
jgi:hypothetical protein